MSPSIPKQPDFQNDPAFAGAVDLNDVRAKAEEEKARADAAALQAAQEHGERWFRAMNRAFKGIYPRDRRRKDLQRQLRKMEADDA